MDFTDANSAEILSEIGLKQFFADSVEHLPEDYFETNETDCSICQDVSIDDEITHGNIVKIKDCTHEFHRTCLYEWLDTHDSVKTYPLCRDNLYTKPESIDKACANPDTDVGRYGLQDGIRGAAEMDNDEEDGDSEADTDENMEEEETSGETDDPAEDEAMEDCSAD